METNECPGCGSLIEPGADACPKCRTKIRYVGEREELSADEAAQQQGMISLERQVSMKQTKLKWELLGALFAFVFSWGLAGWLIFDLLSGDVTIEGSSNPLNPPVPPRPANDFDLLMMWVFAVGSFAFGSFIASHAVGMIRDLSRGAIVAKAQVLSKGYRDEKFRARLDLIGEELDIAEELYEAIQVWDQVSVTYYPRSEVVVRVEKVFH